MPDPLKEQVALEQRCLNTIAPRYAPDGVPQALIAQPQQSSVLGWYRGRHYGEVECIALLIKLGHPRIAKKLQKRFNHSDREIQDMLKENG